MSSASTGLVYKKPLNIIEANVSDASPQKKSGSSEGKAKLNFLTPGEYSLVLTGISFHSKASDPTWTNLKLELKDTSGASVSTLLSVPGESTFYKGHDGSNFNLPLKTYLEFLKSVGMENPKDLDKYTRALWKSFDWTVAAKLVVQAVLGYKKGTYHVGLVKGSGYCINDANGTPLTDDLGAPLYFEEAGEAKAEMASRGLSQGYVNVKYFKNVGSNNISSLTKVSVKPVDAEDDSTPF